MRKPWHLELNPWPYWGQLVDWTADAQPDENRSNNCGPESLAMCLKYLTGVELPSDYVKDVEYGEGFVGYTDTTHLERFLLRYANTHSRTIQVGSMRELLYAEWRHLLGGRPAIGLFSFSRPGAADGHFRPVVGMDMHSVYTADPWTAKRRREGYAEHWAWSKGILTLIDRRRSILP